MDEPIYKNREFLYEEIVVKDKSCHKVAEELKVQRDTIAHWAKKFGIDFAKRHPNVKKTEEIIKDTNIQKDIPISIKPVEEKVEGTVLGKKVDYKFEYNPDVLVAVPRIENRTKYNIDETNLPFKGYDVWNCYEVSTLTTKGKPINLVGKIVYPCNSKYIVESKSLKLYLNSFNMTKMGNDINDTITNLTNTIVKDLSNKLQTNVKVKLFTEQVYEKTNPYIVFKDYTDIESIVDSNNINFSHYKEMPDIIQIEENKFKTNIIKISSNTLRSLCKITSQPDWGNVYINIKLNNSKTVNLKSLVEYLVSFRNENHFHEEITEMIYKRLFDKFQPFIETLVVGTIYVRRGGIDICPIRSLTEADIDNNFINENIICKKKYRQ